MRRLTLEELSDQSQVFDHAVEATADIDHFCSSSDWVLPAATALMPPREPWIFSSEGCFWAFMRGQHPDGFGYLEPLEAMWALACPTLGSNHQLLVEGLDALCAEGISAWKIMALPGLAAGSELFLAIVSHFAADWQMGLGQSTARLIVDLDGGVDAFLSRRSREFRRGLLRSERKVESAGIEIVDAADLAPEELFARIQDVESRSWKGRQEVGITEGGMHDFYEQMMPRLCRRGAQRVLFARHEERDVAYIFGGLRLGGYRGLQFSYDDDFREYGLGNVLQIEQIRLLCDEGALTYDLGMHMEYKLRWADREHETVTLLLMR